MEVLRYVSGLMREIAKKEDKAIFMPIFTEAIFPQEFHPSRKYVLYSIIPSESLPYTAGSDRPLKANVIWQRVTSGSLQK
jgi:hypothetical protein